MKKVFLFSVFAILIVFNTKGQSIKNCSTCGKILLTEKQLEGKSIDELALLRNEIFARKGYVFKNEMYQEYFEAQDWYKPAASNDGIKLSNIETQNVNLLKSLEEKIQKKRDAAIRDLKKLKKAINENNEQVVDNFLHEKDGSVSYLKEILNYMNLDDINWNRGRALYSVQIDNGFQISTYRIFIDDNIITIRGGNDRHSEIFGDFNDGYSNYHSEGESALWWIFEMTDNGIVFKEFNGAG